MTTAFVRALQEQTDDGLLKVGATCKHFAGYSLEQWSGISRFEFDAKISARDLAETYLPAFSACVAAQVSSVMCSYNLINGGQRCALARNSLHVCFDACGRRSVVR
jgi:beta-glucosidase-like glycosyl hydrolase